MAATHQAYGQAKGPDFKHLMGSMPAGAFLDCVLPHVICQARQAKSDEDQQRQQLEFAWNRNGNIRDKPTVLHAR